MKARAGPAEVDNAVAKRWLNETSEKKPWRPGLFDVVISMRAVHEIRHKRHVPWLYAQAATLVRPEGVLIISLSRRKAVTTLTEGDEQPRREAAPALGREASAVIPGGQRLPGLESLTIFPCFQVAPGRKTGQFPRRCHP